MPFILKLILLFIPVFGFLFLRRRLKPLWSFIAILYLLGLSTYPLLSVGRMVYLNYPKLPEWDFLCFWSSARVAVQGGDFYDPQSFYSLSLPYEPSEPFKEEWMNVGFWYPPTTMLLFLPLGLLEFSTGYFIWQFVNILLSFACIYVLWRSFLAEHGLFGLLLVAALLLTLTPSRSTFWFAQTNFLLLLLFLLFWRNRSKAWSGIFITVCAVIKPYMFILFLYPLLTRKWKQFLVAIAAMLLLVFMSVFIFGPEVFIRFLSAPAPDVPSFYYTEPINQSLLSTVLRVTGYQGGGGLPLSNPLYLGISALLAALTGWAIVRDLTARDDWVVLSLLFFALLIYPGTLAHYGVFLMVPITFLLGSLNSSNRQRVVVFVIIFVTYLLSGFNNSGNYVFIANLFVWLICISSGLGLLDQITEHIPALSFSH